MKWRTYQRILSGLMEPGAIFGLLVGIAVIAAPGCGGSTDNPEKGSKEDGQLLGEYRLASGPLEEIRFERDTRDRIVVSGFAYFPEQTRLSLRLLDSEEQQLGLTQVIIVNSLFRSLPLGPDTGLEPGEYVIVVTASFSSGSQEESVLIESREGLALTGEGMDTTVHGDPAFEKRFSVTL